MFTGIIAAIGRIASIETLGSAADSGVRLHIHAATLGLEDVALGDSIAINGACMTVVEKDTDHFRVDVSRESLNRTVGLNATGEVNLEKAMRLSDRVGGHLVSGHVDGIGHVRRFAPVGESWELVIRAPQDLAKYFAYKGSVTVNGVSLTVNRIEDTEAGPEFSINLIPHTIAHTTLKHLEAGSPVNLEIDQIARYIERMLSVQ
jgi:riboflavin synthase